MFGLPDIASKLLGVAAACIIAFTAGFYTEHQFVKAAQVDAANAALVQTRRDIAKAQQTGAAAQAQADLNAGAFQKSTDRVRTVTNTILQDVPHFIAPNPVQTAQEAKPDGQVPDSQPAIAVVYGVPCGLLRVLDAAATGTLDPSSLAICAGQSDDAPSGMDLSRFAGVLVQNIGAFEDNREQVIALQDHIRLLQLFYAKVQKNAESGK